VRLRQNKVTLHARVLRFEMIGVDINISTMVLRIVLRRSASFTIKTPRQHRGFYSHTYRTSSDWIFYVV